MPLTLIKRSSLSRPLNQTEFDQNYTSIEQAYNFMEDTVLNLVAGTTFAESVDDRVAQLLQPGAGITLSYNDPLNTLTISSTVPTVFGRSGAITAQTGDYTVSQVTGAAPLDSPAFINTPTAPTALPGTSTTQLATTAFVATSFAPLASPAFSGTPTGPSAAPGTNTTQLATTAFVATSFAPLASPTFTGIPAAPTATAGTNTTQIATTAFVATSFAPLASPTFTGIPAAPTAAVGTNTTQLATTAFVTGSIFTAATNRTNVGSGAAAVTDNSIRLGNAAVTLASFNGDGAAGSKAFGIDRNTTAASGGWSINLSAGAAVSGGTNLPGGLWGLNAGLGTGNSFAVGGNLVGTTLNTASGTADQALANRAMFGHGKIVTNSTSKPFYSCSVANGSVGAFIVKYGVEVFNGTDLQVEVGHVMVSVTNKAGVIANNVATKLGNQQAATAGTLTVAWAVSAANPAVISVTVTSSLAPSTGYPRVFTSLENLSNQAVSRDLT